MAFKSSDDTVLIIAAVFVSMLALLQGLDQSEIAGFTAMQGFLMDYGYYSPAHHEYVIKPNIQLLITVMINTGAAVGTIIAGPLGTRFGQKYGLTVCACVSIIGSVIQASSSSLGGLLPGRLFVGAGIGMANNFILVYQSEVAPRKLRAVFLAVFAVFVALGQFVGTCVNQGTYNIPNAWCYRIPLLTQLLFPVIFLSMVWYLPQSPRFLVSRGRVEEAYVAYRQLHGDSDAAKLLREKEMREIIAFVEFEKETRESTSYLDCFRGTDCRRTVIAVGLMTCQLWAGRDFLGSYGTYFFSVAGVENPFATSIILGMSTLVSTVVAIPLVYFVGRRAVLLVCVAVFTSSLFIFSSVGVALPGTIVASRVLVSFMVIYNCFFHISLGSVGSMMIAELPSTRLRFKAQSLAVLAAYLWGIIWTCALPYLINPTAANLGAKIGFIYGGFGIFMFLFIFLCVPELFGRSLEEVDEMFMKKVPARQFSSFVCTGEVNHHSVDEKIMNLEEIAHVELGVEYVAKA
jgi:SP family sugar:H+ symporter-like MFS transporter